MVFENAYSLYGDDKEVVVVDVIELEDVFCLFGCGSFLLIVQYLWGLCIEKTVISISYLRREG